MQLKSAPFLHMLNSYRILWAMGGYGSGKTLEAFDLASTLYDTGRYRYILGNVNSVWTDNPELVELREGAFVDAIVILDEGGLFLRMSRNADQFLLGLRKLNITIVVPSVLPPATKIKILQLQRVFNGNVIGLPLWTYEYRLNVGSTKEKGKYHVWKPSQIFGIYDTLDYPIDDCYLADWFEYWMLTAREVRPAWCTWGPPPKVEVSRKRQQSRSLQGASQGENLSLEEVGGLLEETIEGQAELSESLSLHAFQSARKKRKIRR
jgi:hypothetical protein